MVFCLFDLWRNVEDNQITKLSRGDVPIMLDINKFYSFVSQSFMVISANLFSDEEVAPPPLHLQWKH